MRDDEQKRGDPASPVRQAQGKPSVASGTGWINVTPA